MRIILVSFFVLAIALPTPAYAYYPEWPRSYVGPIGTLGTLLSHDFNGDGRVDVVGRRTDHIVFLSLGQADRTFAAPVAIYTGTNLTDLDLGDANGDGLTDLVVSDMGTNSLVVVPSNGNGTFGTPIVSALLVAPSEFATADFNGDDATDIALYSNSDSLLVVFTNDGAGHFSEGGRTAAASVHSVLGGDIDGDGKADFLVRQAAPTHLYLLYFGRGDMTFDPVVTTPASAAPLHMKLADLDEDGDLEILAAEIPSAVSVIVNTGSRTFAARTDYPAMVGTGTGVVNVAVAEVTGDDHTDVVAVLLNGRHLATLAGNGNGTLRAPDYAPVPSFSFSNMFPRYLAAGDFTGDGRIDLAVAGSSSLAMFANAAGDGRMFLTAVYPTISAGQTAKFEVGFQLAEGFQASPIEAPFPTGTITLMNGATPLATGSFANNFATLEVPSLPLGTYTITVSFAGDANYRAFTSSGVSQKVVAETTTIAFTRDGGNDPVPFEQAVYLRANVTSPLPGPLNGSYWLYTNGQRSEHTQGGPETYWTVWPDVGTHDYYVTFEGTATQPPSTSEVLRVTVKKAVTSTSAGGNGNTILRYGEQPEVIVGLGTNPSGGTPGGNVRLYDGSTLIATQFADNRCCSGGMSLEFTLPVLSPGVHYIHAEYEGSDQFEPSESGYARYTVLPADGFNIDAYVAPDGNNVRIYAQGFYELPAGGRFTIYLKVGNGPWTVHDNSFYPWTSVNNPTPGVVYAIRMEAYDQSNHIVASSNADATVIASFTDKPLIGGKRIKALHIKELADAVNFFRNAANLSPLAIPDAGVGQTIKLAHLTALRNALNEARLALGVSPIAFSNGATAGSPVLARHYQELIDTMQ